MPQGLLLVAQAFASGRRMLDTLMVVDDSPTDLLFASIMLERAGVARSLCMLESANDALAQLAHAPHVDLILLDINMPGMDGFDFLAAYQASSLRPVPVVMLTSSPDPADELRARSHSFVRGYLIKPLTVAAAQGLLDLMP
jgi:CheY-like chemotaxis protein